MMSAQSSFMYEFKDILKRLAIPSKHMQKLFVNLILTLEIKLKSVYSTQEDDKRHNEY